MNVVEGLAIGGTTLILLVAALVVGGFVILFRRRGDSGIRRVASGGRSLDELSRRAGSLLVSLDDSLREADDELGYAIAQFGATRARDYADAVATARTKVAEAFRLRQALDDVIPDSEREQREWTLQIIALCEQAQALLDAQDVAFASLRRLEVNAAGTLQDVRARVQATGARIPEARETLRRLEREYSSTRFAAVIGNIDVAEAALARAETLANTAEPGISASGVNDVSSTLLEARQAAHDADQSLDAIERTARDLDSAAAALAELRTKTRADLAEAAVERDKAPDAPTGRGIIDAMAAVEAALGSASGTGDPITELDRIGDAVAQLDLALASARNQAQRLDHARTAYVGTLVSAKSQIAAVREYIGGRGGGVAARTRLAEAERQLALAEAETDPVEALDTVRRAVTHARDADALARYDTMGSR